MVKNIKNLEELNNQNQEEINNWKEIHPDFTEELQKEWTDRNFSVEECKEWLDIGMKPTDADYCAWLYNVVKLTSEQVLNEGDEKSLQGKYKKHLKNQVSERTNWKNIHRDFVLSLQKEWEDKNFSYELTKEWIDCGLSPYNSILANHLKEQGITPRQYSGFRSKNAQEWLDHFYPKEVRKEILELNISDQNLEGSLNLSEFVNLWKLNCQRNTLTSLDVSNCSQLVELNCFGNQLTELTLENNKELRELSCFNNFLSEIDFKQLSSQKLEKLSLTSNNFAEQDLTFLEDFVGLKKINIANHSRKEVESGIYNRFYGSLKPLKNLVKLKELGISNTDIDSGIEYLPTSLKEFSCNNLAYIEYQKEDAKCLKIVKQLEKEKIEVNSPTWKREWKEAQSKKERAEKNKQKEWRNEMWKESTEWDKSDESTKEVLLLLLQVEKSAVPLTKKEEFIQMIEEKIVTKGKKEIIEFFSTWWNSNCAILVSEEKDNKHTISVIVYEPRDKNLKEILKIIEVSNHQTLEEVKQKVEQIKEKLNSDNPVLAVSRNHFFPSDVIERIELDLKKEDTKEEIKNNPDEYLRPLDIIWRKIEENKIIPIYHAAIYLGNKRVVHISVYNELINQIKEYQSKLDDKSIMRTKYENDEWLKSQIIHLQQELKRKKTEREKNVNFIQIRRNDTRVQISTWEKFMRRNPSELIRHHPVIPFKKPKKILEHISRTLFIQFGKEQYNLFTNSCQHFATLCVCGIPFSEQVEKVNILRRNIKLSEEIKKNNKMFETVDLEKILSEVIVEAETKLVLTAHDFMGELTEEENKKLEKYLPIDYLVVSGDLLTREEIENNLKKVSSKITDDKVETIYKLYKECVKLGNWLGSLKVEREMIELEDRFTSDFFSKSSLLENNCKICKKFFQEDERFYHFDSHPPQKIMCSHCKKLFARGFVIGYLEGRGYYKVKKENNKKELNAISDEIEDIRKIIRENEQDSIQKKVEIPPKK